MCCKPKKPPVPVQLFTGNILTLARQILPSKPTRMTIKFSADLRAANDKKYIACDRNSTWTAFINKSGHLVHVVNADEKAVLRLPFEDSLKFETQADRHALISARMAKLFL